MSRLPPGLYCGDDLHAIACASEFMTLFGCPTPQNDSSLCKSGPLNDVTFKNDDYPSVDTPYPYQQTVIMITRLSIFPIDLNCSLFPTSVSI